MSVSLARPLKCTAGVDKKFNRTYKATYQVIADLFEGPQAVLNAFGIPTWGSPFTWGLDFDAWSFSNGYNANPIEMITFNLGLGEVQCWKWHVEVTWSTESSERSMLKPKMNPLEEPPVISGSFVGNQERAVRDKDGKPIVNTAAEPYIENAPTRYSNLDSLEIAFNTPTIDLVLRNEMMGRVNSEPIWGLGIRQALLLQWGYKIANAGELEYIQNTLSFQINRTQHPTQVCIGTANAIGWYTTLPNRGIAPFTVAGDLTSKIVKRDKHDTALQTTIMLKCDGTEETAPEADHWNTFAVEYEADFHEIPGLPDPLPGPFV